MSSSLANRILAISLTIALCVSLTSGFTLKRIESSATITEPLTTPVADDLTSHDSVHLEVKDLMRRANDSNEIKTKATENEQIKEEVMFHINTNYNESSSVTPEASITEINFPDSLEKTILENKYVKNTETNRQNSISINSTASKMVKSVSILEPKPKDGNYTDLISDYLIKKINDALGETTETSLDTTVLFTNTDQVAIDTETTEKYTSDSQTDITSQVSVITDNNVDDTTTIPEDGISKLTLHGVEEKPLKTFLNPIVNKLSDKLKDNFTPSNNDIEISTDVTLIDSEQITTIEPSWKKYVTIDRKRMKSEDFATVNDYLIVKPTDKVPASTVSQPERIEMLPESTVNDYLFVKPTDNVKVLTDPTPKRIDMLPESTVNDYLFVKPTDNVKVLTDPTPKRIDMLPESTVNDYLFVKPTDNVKVLTDPTPKRTDLLPESTVKEFLFVKPTDKVPALTVHTPERINLLPQNNHHIRITASDQDITTIANKILETDQIVSSLKNDDKRLNNFMDTKRAGFLDYSKTSPYESSTMPTDVNESSEPQFTTNSIQAHSVLVDDAIKEELLREEIINNKKQYQEDIKLNSYKTQGESTVDSFEVISSTESVDVSNQMDKTTILNTENLLSVQPIHQDRRTTLYTISPNYKPMKKIDVQPPKPFVRDPDDNSWRNESISSLGIVFNPKNASKSFREVLKNKTETEFNMLIDGKDSKNEVPDLRLRLEKIAEVRKSKKKKTNKAGEVVYIDYEENSSVEGTTSRMDYIMKTYNSITPMTETSTQNNLYKTSTVVEEVFKKFAIDADTTTIKPNQFFHEYYDSTEEEDEYVTPPNIDLKKNKWALPTTATPLRHHTYVPFSRPSAPAPRRPTFPERKPTVQYFPPQTTTPKVNVDHYDDDFEKKVNFYTSQEPEYRYTTDSVATDRPTTRRTSPKPMQFTAFPRTISPPRLSSPQGFVANEGNFNRGAYVIKHYRDILRDAVKSSDAVKDFGYLDPPSSQRHPEEEERSERTATTRKGPEPDYMDYDLRFRKDMLNRFVDYFNQNSDRYKIDFPILYNNSVVHQKYDDEGRVLASSSAFVKGLYGHPGAPAARADRASGTRSCDPNCDFTVELSPAYELHYYVPEQEEKEQVDLPSSFKV